MNVVATQGEQHTRIATVPLPRSTAQKEEEGGVRDFVDLGELGGRLGAWRQCGDERRYNSHDSQEGIC